ncbi:MAG: hypothetical protein HY859_16825 [Caulobacterales bacterium]|nr:hypothetical protein [Caulobacterales bacterium]
MKFDWIGTAFEGVRVVSRKPVTVVVWGAAFLAIFAAFFGPLIPLVRSHDAIVEKVGANPWVMMLAVAPFALFLATVLGAAVYRSVLRPEQSRFAYLRLGADEARLAVFFLALITCTGLLFLLTRSSGRNWFIGMVALLAVSPMVCLIGAGIFVRRKLDFLAGWRAAKGHYWSLLGMNVITWIQYMLLSWLVQSVWKGFVLANSDHFMSPSLGGPAFIALLFAVFSAIVVYYAVMLTIAAAPAAAAYRFLAKPIESELETFD